MEKEEQIKEAFQKVKEDIDYLRQENNIFRDALIETRERMSDLTDVVKKITELNVNISKVLEELKDKKQEKTSNSTLVDIPTLRHIIPTHSTDIKPLNSQIMGISTGNGGVPTDRQTDRQTDRHIEESSHNNIETTNLENKTPIQDASKILDSLDSLKKEIRLKFKRLTDQEILVFSTLYQLEEENGHTDYKALSLKLGLTESSIRDYIGRLIKKGIPVDKNKINNKSIQLSISQDLKKVASLQTILQLRDI